MPTYAYRCKDCGTDLEVVQKFTDDALTECPECQGTLRKVFNAVGVVFKGSGFYRTDSRAQDKNRSGDSGNKETSGKESGGKESNKDSGSKKESGSKDSGSAQPAQKSGASGAKSTASSSAAS